MDRLSAAIKKIIPQSAFRVIQPAHHFFLAFFAALCCGFPSRKIKVIGVTGTKGKTTAVELIREILGESGVKIASASSLRFKIGECEAQNDLKMTMPGRFFIQKFLRSAARAGCAYAVLEVTSQGIVQYRHRFIRFHGSVMTNVAPEHLESHGGFENYLRAKLDIFWRLPASAIAVINRDDPLWQRFSSASVARKIFYGKNKIMRNGEVWNIRNATVNSRGLAFVCGDTAMSSSLLGEFNLYNVLAAVSVGLAEHIAPERIAAGVARVAGVPGRMEFVQHNPFAVVVDYAHTPDSLKNAYAFLRENSKLNPRSHRGQNSRMICVLGAAGGGRDKWKRPEFGKIARQFCDEIILTNEDPYDENPEAILDEIASGFSQIPHAIPDPIGDRIPNARKILDRRGAIRAAVRNAKPSDTVIITGKGAEPWIMGPGGSKISWDDRAVAREELRDMTSEDLSL